jgi:hypothetical protein
MLINVPYRPGDVVTLKLSTGEEVIGKYEADEKDGISISKPLVLTAGPQGGLALTPYMFTADASAVVFKNHHVICVAASLKQANDQYFQATTGIQTVGAGAIQGI